VWSLGWSARGFAIEKIIGKNLPDAFPTIDRWKNGIAASIKSVDLAAPTYANVDRLSSRLTKYVDNVAAFNGAEFGTTAIRASQIKGRELILAIPDTSWFQPSFSQVTALKDLGTYAASKGVSLTLVPVK
jgi:hypothetical protein